MGAAEQSTAQGKDFVPKYLKSLRAFHLKKDPAGSGMALRCRAWVGRADVWVGMVGAGLGPLQRNPTWGPGHPMQTRPQPPTQHSPSQGKLGKSASPAHLLIKIPSMFWPSLIPIKRMQGINYQISG